MRKKLKKFFNAVILKNSTVWKFASVRKVSKIFESVRKVSEIFDKIFDSVRKVLEIFDKIL